MKTYKIFQIVFSVILLLIVLFILGNAVYNSAQPTDVATQTYTFGTDFIDVESATAEELTVSIPIPSLADLVGITPLITAMVAVAGLLITLIVNWREEMRKEAFFTMELKARRLEIEKLTLEINSLRDEYEQANNRVE